jgi:hypothetical protein
MSIESGIKKKNKKKSSLCMTRAVHVAAWRPMAKKATTTTHHGAPLAIMVDRGCGGGSVAVFLAAVFWFCGFVRCSRVLTDNGL